MPKNQGRPSPATVIACIALFFALSGSAIALQGRNTVDSGDIKPKAVKTSDIANNAVTTKKIKNNHVRAADIQNNAVGTGEIRNGQVAPADFAQQEAYHLVTLSNGGEGDCIWTNAAAPPITPNPAAFYKDALGEVHLTGLPSSNDGPGGDGVCGGGGAENIEDATVFVLPEGYRPANDEVRVTGSTTGDTWLIVGTTDIVAPGITIPAGSVLDLGNVQTVLLDGESFRAADTGSGFTRRGAARSGDVAAAIAELVG